MRKERALGGVAGGVLLLRFPPRGFFSPPAFFLFSGRLVWRFGCPAFSPSLPFFPFPLVLGANTKIVFFQKKKINQLSHCAAAAAATFFRYARMRAALAPRSPLPRRERD